ncbi:MAG TPA: hypothetical protein DCQ90_06520 [Erysipelotrichaceae bacterium]|nr:hypothetical protein [Erysipelotrichaceae bacterium]
MSKSRDSSFSYNDVNVNVKSIVEPNICPICKHAISPVLISISINSATEATAFYFCTACKKSFISLFTYIKNTSTGYNHFTQYTGHAPQSFSARKFDKVISDLSARFSITYNQALHAESIGLFEVAGPGYRKSLEILVKDYAIIKHPEDKIKITGTNYTLSQCINDYIKDNRIKSPSIAATWLGNDATHYTKKHEDKELSDLKHFIDTVVYFIQYDLSADSASDFVEKK